MLKSSLILWIISLLMLFGLVGDPVSLSLNMPDSAQSNSEFLVEVTISKGDIEGFARFQQKLPDGFKAVARQTANGDFSFVDQKVKIQWMKVPYDKELVVSYAIQVDPGIAAGNYNFGGSFSYIMDNSVQVANLENKSLTVITDEASQNLVNQPTMVIQKGDVQVNLKTVDCIRQKPYLNSDNEIIVNLLVNKGSLNGFGKIQEQIPVGYRAESIRSKNSIFTYKNHIVKFLWMNMPNNSGDENYVVSYKLIPEGDIPDEEFQIIGTFSYAESDRTKTINIAERNVDLEKDSEEPLVQQATTEPETTSTPIASYTPAPEPTYSYEPTSQPETTPSSQTGSKQTVSNQTPSTSTTVSEPTYASNSGSTNSNATTTPSYTSSSQTSATPHQPSRPYRATVEDLTDVPSPEQGGAFRVQIAAGHKLVGKNYFKRLNITDQVQVEIHNGWNKYTVGNFSEYKDARDYRVYVWNNTPIHDAFVSAYNNGMRITVQEALMIANQKWYK